MEVSHLTDAPGRLESQVQVNQSNDKRKIHVPQEDEIDIRQPASDMGEQPESMPPDSAAADDAPTAEADPDVITFVEGEAEAEPQAADAQAEAGEALEPTAPPLPRRARRPRPAAAPICRLRPLRLFRRRLSGEAGRGRVSGGRPRFA